MQIRIVITEEETGRILREITADGKLSHMDMSWLTGESLPDDHHCPFEEKTTAGLAYQASLGISSKLRVVVEEVYGAKQ